MERPTYYQLDEDGYLVGTRLAQRDPRESEAAGEDIWMAPGVNDAQLPAPSDPGPNKVLRWVNGAWTTEDDFRGDTWYLDWDTPYTVSAPGTPQGAPTREELPVAELKAFALNRTFNWGYYEKYGDARPVMVGQTELWSDSVSMQQVLLQYSSMGDNDSVTWKGKNGDVVCNSKADFKVIVDAYNAHQSAAHTAVTAKKAEIEAASTSAEVATILQGMYNDMAESDEEWN